MLDPVARHDFMAMVLTAVADDGVSVVLSSHVLAELERVADYLILLSRGRVQVAGEVDGLLACHRVLTGPAAEADRYTERPVVHVRRAEAHAHLLVRAGADDPVPPGWEAHPVGLEELALAYLREPGAAALPGPARGRAPETGEPSGVREMTALTVPARPRTGREPAAAAVAADGLGHLAAAPDRAGRGGHAAGRAGALRVAHRPSDPPRLYRRGRLPPGQLGCLRGAGSYFITDWQGAQIIAVVLQAVPALIGAFVGAPVLAREMETGTFRYAWTQGFGRSRWTLAKLVPLAVVVAAAAGAFSVLMSWYYQPFLAGRLQFGGSPVPLDAGMFDLRGVAFAAWTLAAFAIGALAGMLIRRVVPAIVATLAAYTGLALAAALYLRQHYMTPLLVRERGRARLRMDHQPGVVRQERPAGQPGHARPGARGRHSWAAGRAGGPAGGSLREPVPRPARVHHVDDLPAGEPVLAVPVDRGRLAARAVGAAHRRHRLAGPPPRRLSRLT